MVGRSSIRQMGSVDISIVNVNQYRSELMTLVLKEINLVQSSLGDGHKIKLDYIDRPVSFARSGVLDVVLFIPYEYSVLPDVQYQPYD